MNKKKILLISAIISISIVAGLIKMRVQQGSALPPNNIVNLKIDDEVVGKGPAAQAGSTVTVHFTGVLAADGKVFDSSKNHNQPMVFKLGEGAVIRGWDAGILGMKAGGKRQLTVPPSLAYGDNGVPGLIPKNAALVYQMELLKVENGADDGRGANSHSKKQKQPSAHL